MKKKMKKIISYVLILSLICSFMMSYGKISIAKAGKTVTIKVGQKKTMALNNAGKAKKVKWSIGNKKVVKITKKSKARIVIKGLKKGKTKVKAVIYKKKGKQIVTANIVVNNRKSTMPVKTTKVPAAPTATNTNVTNKPVAMATPTQKPTDNSPTTKPTVTSTPSTAPAQEPTATPINTEAPIWFAGENVSEITASNAKLYVSIYNPRMQTITKVGCYLYDASGNLLLSYFEYCGFQTTTVNYSCNINQEMKYVLQGKTTYKYVLMAIVNGIEYKDEIRSFTTI